LRCQEKKEKKEKPSSLRKTQGVFMPNSASLINNDSHFMTTNKLLA
jgi:hypothetical protein